MLRNFLNFFNFLAKIPEICKNFHRTLIAIVRLVRSLADRTFQLRSVLRLVSVLRQLRRLHLLLRRVRRPKGHSVDLAPRGTAHARAALQGPLLGAFSSQLLSVDDADL